MRDEAGSGAGGIGCARFERVFFYISDWISSPSIEAGLINRMGLSPDIRRVPMFGLGCVAGAACIARAADYVKAYPDQTAVLLSVELCSLTLQGNDLSMANLISAGLWNITSTHAMQWGVGCCIPVGRKCLRRSQMHWG
jgi:alkylresorcinol/alkylpyrone synthase